MPASAVSSINSCSMAWVDPAQKLKEIRAIIPLISATDYSETLS
jgi:hypothetical protein